MSTPAAQALAERLQLGEAVVRAEALEARRPGLRPSGVAALDALLGGLPVGRIVEVTGTAGAGLTSLGLALAARATGEGGLVAWVAAARDHGLAAEELLTAGVDPQRLLLCRAPDALQAVRAADLLLGSGAFERVVLELPEAPAPALTEGLWVRLARRAEAARATLLLLRPPTAAGAGSQAVASLSLEPVGGRFAGSGPGSTFEGLEARLRLGRSRLLQREGQVLPLQFVTAGAEPLEPPPPPRTAWAAWGARFRKPGSKELRPRVPAHPPRLRSHGRATSRR